VPTEPSADPINVNASITSCGSLEAVRCSVVNGLLMDVVDSLNGFVLDKEIIAVYLVGSAVRQTPIVFAVGPRYIALSDIDLLVFVRQGLPAAKIRKIITCVEAARSASWGVYSAIHIGCRMRPVRALRRTIMEYRSWGADLFQESDLLLGEQIITPELQMLYGPGVPASMLAANVVSKLWFLVYSLPHSSLLGCVSGWESIVLRRRFTSAAVRFSSFGRLARFASRNLRLRPDATSVHEEEWWESRSLPSDLGVIAGMNCAEPLTLDWRDRSELLRIMAAAACEILYRLSGEKQGVYSLMTNGFRWGKIDHWVRGVFSLYNYLIQGRPGALPVKFPGYRSMQRMLLDESCAEAIEAIHRSQLREVSVNLLSYS